MPDTPDPLTAALATPSPANTPRPGRLCKTGRILATVTPAQRALILDHLHGHEWTDVQLARALTAGGHQIGTTTLVHHRLQTCCCPLNEQDTP